MEGKQYDELPPLTEDSDEDESQQSSESEAESPSPGAKRPPSAAHNSSTADGGLRGAFGRKPSAAARSPPKTTAAAVYSVPPLWKAFARSRSVFADQPDQGPLHRWQAFQKENSIPCDFQTWYSTQVLGNRSVPQAYNVPGLPSGFPEFCHWVADGHHKSSGGSLIAGFQSMAERHVNQVKAEEAVSASQSPRGQPPVGGGGSVDPKARKRERRSKKGGTVVNGSDFIEKMKNALDGLDKEVELDDPPQRVERKKGRGGREGRFGVDGYPGATAVGRASGAGARAAAEIAARTAVDIDGEGDVKGGVSGLDAGEVFGPAFAGLGLPSGTQAMAESLRRARTFRRRSERQAELLERELERCLARMARVEAQHRSLSAEARGKECSLDSALESALPLVQKAQVLIDSGSHQQGVERYDDVIKLLEVHVNESTQPGRESEELLQAREMLWLALCNRSITNMVLGDNYSGMRDIVRAEYVWPNDNVRDLRRRIEDFGKTQSRGTGSNWRIFRIPA